MDGFAYLSIGIAIGALGGVPIGPLNAAVFDAACRHGRSRALAIGLGGALADGLYALLGIAGFGSWLERHPGLAPLLQAGAGVALLAYGLLVLSGPPRLDRSAVPASAAPGRAPRAGAGFLLGAALILSNPAVLVSWALILGAHGAEVETSSGLACAFGVAAGALAWLALVACLAERSRTWLGERSRWIHRAVGLSIVGFGLFSLARASYFVWTRL